MKDQTLLSDLEAFAKKRIAAHHYPFTGCSSRPSR